MRLLFVSRRDLNLKALFGCEVQSRLESVDEKFEITTVHSLGAAIDFLTSNKCDLVVAQEDIPVSSEEHPVESFVGGALGLICIRLKVRLALMVREDSPLHSDHIESLNIKVKDHEVAYVFTPHQLDHEMMKISIVGNLFKFKLAVTKK